MRISISAALLLTLVGCPARETGPIRARVADDGTVLTGELGEPGDRLYKASPRGNWLALCRGAQGVLVVDEDRSLPIEWLIHHDEIGQRVLVLADDAVHLIDVKKGTDTTVPGRDHVLSADGRRLLYVRKDADKEALVVRELVSGEERSFTADDPVLRGRFDPSGRFVHLITLVDEEPRPPEEEGQRRYYPMCKPPEGSFLPRAGRSTTTIIAVDEPGTPRLLLPSHAHIEGATYRGWPLFYELPAELGVGKTLLRRWTPAGVETIAEGAHGVYGEWGGDDAVVYEITQDEVTSLVRYEDGKSRPIARAYEGSDGWDESVSGVTMIPNGVWRASEGRWVHLATGKIVVADEDVKAAYAVPTRMLLIGDRVTLVDPASGDVLYRYSVDGTPWYARGPMVVFRGRDGTVVLDLERNGWVGRAPATVVSYSDTGHVLIAATPAADVEDATPTGPFRWVIPVGT